MARRRPVVALQCAPVIAVAFLFGPDSAKHHHPYAWFHIFEYLFEYRHCDPLRKRDIHLQTIGAEFFVSCRKLLPRGIYLQLVQLAGTYVSRTPKGPTTAPDDKTPTQQITRSPPNRY